MGIREDNELKMAFYTRYGDFEYQVILFGLSNLPTSFQDYINKILVKKLDILVVLYLNDILIYTKNFGQLYVDVV